MKCAALAGVVVAGKPRPAKTQPRKKRALAGEFVGRRLEKEWPGLGTFRGTVHSFKAARGLYFVKYDDGDSEEMWPDELAALLLPMTP